MEIRQTDISDIPQIFKLYEDVLNFQMDKQLYDYLYLKDNAYTSSVVLDADKVVAHNAFIHREYLLNGKDIKVLLSSGGMVNPNYSGIFLSLMRQMLKSAKGDVIIAFPNKNSEPFFSRIFKFKVISRNYFTLNSSNFTNASPKRVSHPIKMKSETFSQRLKHHPRHTYMQEIVNRSTFSYKIYNDSIDVIFAENLGEDFAQFIKAMTAKGFRRFNIVSIERDHLTRMGFEYEDNNAFVYQWISKEFDNQIFPCQMIDSDVF